MLNNFIFLSLSDKFTLEKQKLIGDFMKKILLTLMMSYTSLFGQNIKVLDNIPLTSINEGRFSNPIINPEGTLLLFSGENYQGLWYKSLTEWKLENITKEAGAGYDAAFFGKNQLIFRANKFIQGKKYSSLNSYDFKSKKSAKLEDNIRDLKIYKNYENRADIFLKNNQLEFVSTEGSLSKNSGNDIYVYTENSRIVIYKNNQKRFLEPFGKGYYLWLSLSPDKTKLLFTFAGKGTFVTDLNGNIIKKVGYANYPSWSKDGKWILFMKDLDDGEKIIQSNIYIANVTTGKYFKLTGDREDISLFPTWGRNNSEIFYNTDEGQIRVIKLKIE